MTMMASTGHAPPTIGVRLAGLALVVALTAALGVGTADASDAASDTFNYGLDPASGPPGTAVTVSGSGCPPTPGFEWGGARADALFVFAWIPDGNFSGQHQVPVLTDATGTFSLPYSVGVLDPGVYPTAMICFNESLPEDESYLGWLEDDDYAPFTVTEAQAGPFDDVPAHHQHAPGIVWLVDRGITQGCTAQLFCPGDSITRGQMATFLQRALDLPDGSVDGFDDVGADHRHAAGIGAVAEAGITVGCGPGRYCPSDPVSRAQMATFLQRGLDLPAGSVAGFDDVADDHRHADGIGAIAAAGITSGCTSTAYCPTNEVTRAQMATFLRNALDE
jgi:hypothetical protein